MINGARRNSCNAKAAFLCFSFHLHFCAKHFHSQCINYCLCALMSEKHIHFLKYCLLLQHLNDVASFATRRILQQNLKHVCDNPLAWNTSLLSSGPLYFSRRDNQISVVWRSSITHTHTPQPPELKWKQQLESISMVVRVCFIIPSSGYLWIKAKLSEHMIAAPQQNPWCIMLFNWLVYMNKGPPHGLKLIIPLPVKELR